MQPVNSNATRFDNLTIFFHWAIAILVVTQWIGAQTIDLFPKGDLRIDARSAHITGGLTLGVILVLSIIWRRTGGRQLPPPGSKFLTLVANIVQVSLNLLVAAMVLVGITLASARGDSYFNLITIPSFDGADKAVAEQIADIHGTIGWIIIALAGFHAAAALFHHYVWKDGVLNRVRPGGRAKPVTR
jgi:cytochrome b561